MAQAQETPKKNEVEHFAEHLERFRSELLPIHQRHVSALPELPAIHADPFDRERAHPPHLPCARPPWMLAR